MTSTAIKAVSNTESLLWHSFDEDVLLRRHLLADEPLEFNLQMVIEMIIDSLRKSNFMLTREISSSSLIPSL